MKRRTFIKKSAWASAGLAIGPGILFDAVKELSARNNNNVFASNPKDMPVLVLKGSPRERGRIHGETLRAKISELVGIWKGQLEKQRRMSPDKYIAEFLEDTDFTPAIKKWTPDLLEEVKGIAEGASIDLKTMLAYQYVDEEWWYGIHKSLNMPVPDAKRCSALGVYDQRGIPSMVAQNLDIPAFTDGYQVLLHIKHQDSPLESLVFTYAGLISLCGMNNHSIGEVVNALLQLDHRVDGLPVAFVNRGILAQTKYVDALKFVRTIKHASGQNYTIGGMKEVSAYECSANKVSLFSPYKGATRIYHTNHPFVNDDQGIYKAMMNALNRKPTHPNNSEIRYSALEKRLKDPSKQITLNIVKAALSSKDDPHNPICREKRKDGLGGFTAGCLIMELSKSPVLHLAPGPACTTKFLKFAF